MNDPDQSQDHNGATQLIEAKIRLENRAKSGASWFYWISSLSIVNSVIVLSGGTFTFIFGLAITQIIDGFAYVLNTEFGTGEFGLAFVLGLALDLIVALVFAVIGYFARKRNRIPYIIGMTLYTLDTFLLLVFTDWLTFFFHIFAIIGLISGYQAMTKLEPIDSGVVPLESLRPVAVDPELQRQSRRRIIILVGAIIGVCLIGYLLTIVIY
jgi:hypothetical protein